MLRKFLSLPALTEIKWIKNY